jgi:signal transduction histidine kinase
MFRDASLSRRLLLAATAFIAVAMIAAAVAIGFGLHRFVQGQIDQRLDTQIVFLSSMLHAGDNGTLSLTGNADGPPFERRRHGWYWQVTGPNNTLRSQSLQDAALDVPATASRADRPPPRRDERTARDDRPRPADGPGPDDEPLHYRVKNVNVAGVTAMIMASAPRAAVLGPLRDAMTPLGVALGVLGLGLVLAIMLQIRLGLRPLDRLRKSVADVRAGRLERVPSRQPVEIQPLVSELNGLLEQNSANLERARRHVANLAHGLKTPLATLAIALSAPPGRNTDELHPLVNLMERRIRHHLGRARAAVLSGPVRTQTMIAPRINDLVEAMQKIHAEKAVDLSVEIADDIAVACEQQDFDEMAGNLLENAFKWSRGRISVRARPAEGRDISLVIEDDGPGLQPSQISQVLRPGERLDEGTPGFGFGLPITRELAELYGGALSLEGSALGGLRVSLRLPAAIKT